MKIKILLTALLVFAGLGRAQAQWYFQQYFDGADTSAESALFVHVDTGQGNVWQVGTPAKNLFSRANTLPNALVTKLSGPYPINNRSSFTLGLRQHPFSFNILALRWVQKLDLQKGHDAALIEYSVDTGRNWVSVFNNPYVYNFYGFDPRNQDTLTSGEVGFSGRDTTWKDIWLCFDRNYFSQYDTLMARFTLKSDSVQSNQEGWLIDNMIFHNTIIHTVKNPHLNAYLNVYPANTSGVVNIEADKREGYHIIEHMELMNGSGQVVQRFGKAPTKFAIDIRHLPAGHYNLRVTTNFKSKTFPIVLTRR